MKKKNTYSFIIIFISLAIVFGFGFNVYENNTSNSTNIVNNDNVQYNFTEEELEQGKNSFYSLGQLDELGRSTIQIASFTDKDLKVTPRDNISSIYPPGYHQLQDNSIPGKYLYNRCHLVAHSLGGADIQANLITGTQNLNQKQMKQIEDYIREYVYSHPNIHILYKVIPIYNGNDVVPNSIIILVKTIENNDIDLNSTCTNTQSGFIIDYTTGYARKE